MSGKGTAKRSREKVLLVSKHSSEPETSQEFPSQKEGCDRCNAMDNVGYQCEDVKGHKGRHWYLGKKMYFSLREEGK